MKTTAEKIEVMKAHLDGKNIQYKNIDGRWLPVYEPAWDWNGTDYRVEPLDPLRKLTVTEANTANEVWSLDPVQATNVVVQWRNVENRVRLASRNEAYATKEGAEAEAKRRGWIA